MSGVKNNVGRGINVALVNGKNYYFSFWMYSVDVHTLHRKYALVSRDQVRKCHSWHWSLPPFLLPLNKCSRGWGLRVWGRVTRCVGSSQLLWQPVDSSSWDWQATPSLALNRWILAAHVGILTYEGRLTCMRGCNRQRVMDIGWGWAEWRVRNNCNFLIFVHILLAHSLE